MPDMLGSHSAAMMLAVYLPLIGLITFAAFADDKMRARRGLWRISEANLLGLALIGGTPGAYAARTLLRHKTRKISFVNRLDRIAVVQAILAALAFGWWLGG